MMRRLIFSMFALSLFVVAEAQEKTITRYQYWIDQTKLNETNLEFQGNNVDTLEFAIDTDELSEGLHNLYIRVQDSEGVWSNLTSWGFFVRNLPKNDTIKVVSCEYWIDNAFNDRIQIPVDSSTFAFMVDGSLLKEGLHQLSYRVQDNEGMYSQTSTWMFMRNALRDTAVVNRVASVEYWYDSDIFNAQQISAETETIMFSADASMLSEGLHTLSLCACDVLGNKSAPTTWIFYKNTYKPSSKISWYKCWWNNHFDKIEKVTTECDSSVYTFTKELIVPDYAKTDGYSRNSTARFHVVFGDDMDNISNVEYVDVSYPDNQPPVSTIEVEVGIDKLNLTWSANEDDIDFYNIYVSEGGLPFVLWKPNTTSTTAVFKGEAGVEYKFTVTARDKAGNMEKLDETKCVTAKMNEDEISE